MAYCARVERREVVATGRCDTDLLAEALFEDPLLERLDMLRLYVSSKKYLDGYRRVFWKGYARGTRI